MQRCGERQCYSGYSRHLWSTPPRPPNHDKHRQLVWANRWYTPEDLRAIAPVQRHKFLAQHLPDLPSLPDHWVPPAEPPLKAFSRAGEEEGVCTSSSPSSRCEEWSTLRQMLPSSGHCVRHIPPKWGTGVTTPPSWCQRKPRRLPHINSPMTKYKVYLINLCHNETVLVHCHCVPIHLALTPFSPSLFNPSHFTLPPSLPPHSLSLSPQLC